MSDQQHNVFHEQAAAVLIGDSKLLGEVIDIAERALWNPARVSTFEVQTMAAAVVAHVRFLHLSERAIPPAAQIGDGEV